MQRNYFSFRGLKLSYLESGAAHTPKIFIAHANGYAAGCYDYLIQALSTSHHVCALDFVGHGESEGTLAFSSWNFFSDQVLAFLSHKGWASCTAIGHSLGGGSLLRAAIADSAKFRRIIAFDPVMLGFLSISYVRLFGNPMAGVARNRRAQFKSKEQALKIFDRHPGNRGWEKASVKAYVDYCICEKNGAAELCCDPAIEAQIFSQTEYAHLFKLRKIRCETHIILPPQSNVCPAWVARRITRGNSASRIVRAPGTHHLLPFENRALTLQLIADTELQS